MNVDTNGEIDLNDDKAVWNKALSPAAIGSIDEASMYFQMHAQLIAKSKKKTAELDNISSETLVTKKRPIQIDLLEPSDDDRLSIFTEGGISFITGAVTSHMDIGFTPYFDRNLQELKGPIPLTIFNKNWQDLGNSYHVEKIVKTDNLNKDITTYTGYPYPHEMTQSYAV